MVRGRKIKVVKPPSRSERSDKIRARLVSLSTDLIDTGNGSLLPPLGPIQLLAPAINDPKTGGWVGHVEETLGTYIQRVSVVDNFSQRPPFDHVTDPIYRRLMRDFIEGAAMPEAKIAALSRVNKGQKAESLEEPDISYSVID